MSAAPDPKPDKNPGNVVRFETQDGSITFRASRHDVLLVLRQVSVMHWGWLVELRGTQPDLISAAVATPDMFEDIGKSGQKTAWTQHAVQYKVRRRKQYFDLELWLQEEPGLPDPGDDTVSGMALWRKHGGGVDAVVAEALQRMRRPREKAQP